MIDRVRHRASGFTLLEMLVVVMLVSLIMTLLMQAFLYVLQFRGRFLSLLEEQRVETLQYSWVHSVISSLTTVRSADYGLFTGDTEELRGLTLNALDRKIGVPVAFTLRLIDHGGETRLGYEEDEGVDWILGTWPGTNDGFRYLDAAGEWHTNWPHANLDSMEQLPAAIQISWSESDENRVWLVRLRGDHQPKPDLQSASAR